MPPDGAGASGGFCRRIDADGALVLSSRTPLPAAGATLQLRLAGDVQAPALQALEVSASMGAPKGGGDQKKVPLGQLLNGGSEGSVAMSSIVDGEHFDQVAIKRSQFGSDIVTVCIDTLALTY